MRKVGFLADEHIYDYKVEAFKDYDTFIDTKNEILYTKNRIT